MTSTIVIESPFRLPVAPSEPDLVAKYLRVLSDPIRLRIVELIASAYGFRYDTKFCYCPEPDEVRAVQQCVQVRRWG